MELTRESSKVPEAVLRHLQGTLASLRRAARRLEQTRALDRQFDGGGRYESECYEDIWREERVAPCQANLERFRQDAVRHGVDADAVLRECGDVPDLTLSERARQYRNRYHKQVGCRD